MGKGDKKTKKGKITMGSFGVSRPRKKAKSTTSSSAKETADKPAKKEAPAKKAAAKKAAPAKKAAAKKTKKEE